MRVVSAGVAGNKKYNENKVESFVSIFISVRLSFIWLYLLIALDLFCCSFNNKLIGPLPDSPLACLPLNL